MSRIVVGTGIMLGLGLAAANGALAQSDPGARPALQPAVQPAPRPAEVGHATRAWLDLQSSNSEAAPALPMLGAEAGLAYHRYLESFKSRIPDLYESALSTNGGGGSQAGSDFSSSASH
ncbi:DUF3613 domain-containing protein [Paraburkholderia sp. PREW-6R]|uniref:DUF3613 domain-containing protein n=1 Tax=Paraburkholderia sp. PREW-6R TaxID=3141544 RepID=UPI0031F4DD27